MHLRLDTYGSPADHPDDDMIVGLITAAREWAEKFLGRIIVHSLVEAAYDEFPKNRALKFPFWSRSNEAPEPIYLSGAPVRMVVGVTYNDPGGGVSAISGYQLDDIAEPPRLLPEPGADWPGTQSGRINSVRVLYEAGYALPGESPAMVQLPKVIKQGILLLIGHMYENREDTSDRPIHEIPMGAQNLMRRYRLEDGFS